VFSRFSDDVPGELPGYVAAAEPDTIVLGAAGEALRADDRARLVTARAPGPDEPAAVAVYHGHGPHAAAALDVAAQLAAARHLPLVLVGEGRRARAAAAELSHKGIPASSGPPPEGSLLVAMQDDASAAGRAHLTVRAGSGEDIGDRPEIGTPVSALAQEGQQ
jgi:hypothetical protein